MPPGSPGTRPLELWSLRKPRRGGNSFRSSAAGRSARTHILRSKLTFGLYSYSFYSKGILKDFSRRGNCRHIVNASVQYVQHCALRKQQRHRLSMSAFCRLCMQFSDIYLHGVEQAARLDLDVDKKGRKRVCLLCQKMI